MLANKQRFVCASEAFGGIKEIKLLGREMAYLSRYKISSFEFALSQAKYQAISQVPKYLIEAVAFGGLIPDNSHLVGHDGSL